MLWIVARRKGVRASWVVGERMAKRAIVYVSWGEKHIAEAVESARSAGFLGLDRVLITTPESLAWIPPGAPFERVSTHTFGLPALLGKSEVGRLLPKDYDTFLLLDSDTHVLMDVSFGFESAELHGIAAAMASHYSLEHFWGFDRVLAQVDFPSVDTLQYNTGALFLARRDDVWAVLDAWHDLCATLGMSQRFPSDQPFFTLAMERLDFNPYTLSRAYNYRDSGEPVSGYVRIWHSRRPPPADVNVFDKPWPPRAFINGRRLEYSWQGKTG